MGNTNNINIAFKEDEYRDIVYVMDGYIDRLRRLYTHQENIRKNNTLLIAINVVSVIVISYAAYGIYQLNLPSPFNQLTLVIAAILIVSIGGISIIMHINRAAKNSFYAPSQGIRETIYARKQLLRFVKYISQVLDHNDFSAPKKFLMDLKLSEAEEVINLTEKFFQKHYKKIQFSDET